MLGYYNGVLSKLKVMDLNCRISMSREEFYKVKDDEVFPVVLSFARSINALHFVFFSSANYTGDTVCDKKYRTNSFFFTLSVLYEGFNIIDENYVRLSKLNSFKNGFEKLLSDKKFRRFRQEVMGKMRNNYCFHFLTNMTNEIVDYLDFDEYDFAIADGKKADDIYYALSDLIGINMIVKGNKKTEKNDEDYLVEIIEYTMHIAKSYTDCAELVIEEFIDRTNWEVKNK